MGAFRTTSLLSALALVAGCASDKTTSGGTPDVFIANAGEAGSQITRCRERLGGAAITESDSNAQALQSAGLPRSMAPLMRQLMMQTRCFAVLERGAAFAALEHEQRIREQQGHDRADQLAAMTPADYVIRGEIVFVEQTGGSKGAIGALLGNAIGGVLGESRQREALVVMSAVDARTSEVVASAFGRGTNQSAGLGSVILGGGAIAVQGGWLDTPQAKPVAAALVDAWNQLLPRLAASREEAREQQARERTRERAEREERARARAALSQN